MSFHTIGFYGNTPDEILYSLDAALSNYKRIKIDVPKSRLDLVKQILDDKGVKYSLEPDYTDYKITIVKEEENK